MKLNPDCLRAVLIAYEALPAINREIGLKIEGFSDEELYSHQQLLEDAGFIELSYEGSSSDPYLTFPKRLTYAGHEFLNASRDESNWKAVKNGMLKAGGFVIEVAKPLLIELLKSQISGLLFQGKPSNNP